MKLNLFTFFFATISANAGNDSPSDHLENLLDSAIQILTSGAYDDFNGPNFVSRWEKQFTKNKNRLSRNLNNVCADKNAVFASLENIDTANPCIGMGQVLDGFLAWSDAFLGGCTGQRQLQHQFLRHQKWTDVLVHEACSGKTTLPQTTTTTTLETTTTSVPSFYYYTLTQDVASHYESLGQGGYHDYTIGYNIKLSTVCNPNWAPAAQPAYTCKLIASNFRYCGVALDEASWIQWTSITDNGFETFLNCPQCGCTDDNINEWNVK